MTAETIRAQAGLDPVFPAGTPSLAEALQDFAGRSDSDAERVAAVRTAVALFSRLTGLAPEQVPANRMYIMRQWERIKKRPVDVAPKTIANAKSSVKYLLDQTVPQSGHSEFAPLCEAWQRLRDLPELSELKLFWALTRFICFCSSRQIAPAEVSEAVVDQYEAWLVELGDVSKPRDRARAVMRNWNAAARKVPGWPGQRLHFEKKGPPRKWLRLEQFPAAFAADAQAWLDRLGRRKKLGEKGPRRPSREISVNHREGEIRRAATALHLSGVPLAGIVGLNVLTKPENFGRLLQFLLDENGGNGSDSIHHLAGGLIAIAQHYLETGDAAVRMLQDMRRQVLPEESRAGKRALERLEKLQAADMKQSFLGLPARLIDTAESKKTPKRSRPVLAQVAICLEIALFTSFRRKNLAELRVDDLKVVIVDGDERFRIVRNPGEVKNGRTLDRELPNESVHLIRRGLKLYDQRGGWLFPGRKGKAKDIDFLGKQVKAVIERHLDITFNLHLVRAFIATETIIATGSVEAAALAIGDANIEMVRRAYGSAADRVMMRRAQDELLKIRSTRPAARPALRRKKAT